MNTCMTSRERVLAALNHEEPDRVPMDLGACTVSTVSLTAYLDLKRELGLDIPSRGLNKAARYVMVDEEVLQALGIDTRMLYSHPTIPWDEFVAEEPSLVDSWGITHRRSDDGYYYVIAESPLNQASLREIEAYAGPDLLSEDQIQDLKARAKSLRENTDYASICNLPSAGIFEVSWYLRGFSSLLTDMVIEPLMYEAILEKVLAIQMARYGQVLDAVGQYVDVVLVADDVAMQNGPIMSPDLYRTMVKPYQKRYFEFIKSKTDAKLLYHCCGNVADLVRDFIDIGVDALNPVQVAARQMDTLMLKKKFGKSISFWGGVDTQSVLPRGSVEDVRNEVSKRIKDLAPGGGYVIAPVHAVQPDVPGRNLIELYKAAREFGKYPIQMAP